MAIIGQFDPEYNPKVWFDASAKVDGWFDGDFVPAESAGGGGGTINYVNSSSYVNQPWEVGTTCTTDTAIAITATNHLLAFVKCEDAAPTVNDTAGNGFGSALFSYHNGAFYIHVFECNNCLAHAANFFTATTSTSNNIGIYAVQHSGVAATSNLLMPGSGYSYANNTVATGSFNIATVPVMALAMVFDRGNGASGSTSFTDPSGYTNRLVDANVGGSLSGQFYTTTQTGITATVTTATSWLEKSLIVVTFEAASSSTSPITAVDYITTYSTAVLKAKGALKGNDNLVTRSTAIINGKGALKANDSVINYSTAALVGKVAAKGNDIILTYATANITGKGALKGNDSLITISNAILKGKGNLSGLDYIEMFSSAVLSGGLTLRARDFIETYSSAVLTGKGALKANDYLITVNSATIKGKGSVSASVKIEITSAALLKGRGNLKAVDELVMTALADLKGKGALVGTDYITISVVGHLKAVTIYGGILRKHNGTEWMLYRLTRYNGVNVEGFPMYIYDTVTAQWKEVQQL